MVTPFGFLVETLVCAANGGKAPKAFELPASYSAWVLKLRERDWAAPELHTPPFNTSYGILNLWDDYIADNMSASNTREFNEEEHNKKVTGCEDMHRYFEKFSNESLDDCMVFCPFPWSKKEMKSLYMTGVRL